MCLFLTFSPAGYRENFPSLFHRLKILLLLLFFPLPLLWKFHSPVGNEVSSCQVTNIRRRRRGGRGKSVFSLSSPQAGYSVLLPPSFFSGGGRWKSLSLSPCNLGNETARLGKMPGCNRDHSKSPIFVPNRRFFELPLEDFFFFCLATFSSLRGTNSITESKPDAPAVFFCWLQPRQPLCHPNNHPGQASVYYYDKPISESGSILHPALKSRERGRKRYSAQRTNTLPSK